MWVNIALEQLGESAIHRKAENYSDHRLRIDRIQSVTQ
jgi:hypothetical protein